MLTASFSSAVNTTDVRLCQDLFLTALPINLVVKLILWLDTCTRSKLLLYIPMPTKQTLLRLLQVEKSFQKASTTSLIPPQSLLHPETSSIRDLQSSLSFHLSTSRYFVPTPPRSDTPTCPTDITCREPPSPIPELFLLSEKFS